MAQMSEVWVAVVLVGAMTVLLKSLGPVFLGGRELPGAVAGVVALLAPALLSALVVTQTFGGERELVLDARLVGVGAAAGALLLRAPILLVLVIAAAATATSRAIV
jgi:hypothetical protein